MVTFLTFIFGLIIGSFLNVVILRLPKEQTLSGRSECPKCKHELQPLDLVPVFSYLFLRGKCRYCKAKISPRYMIIELVTGLLFALASLVFVPVDLVSTLELIRVLFITSVLIAVFVIDFEHYLILDAIVYPSIIVLALMSLGIDLASGSSLFVTGIFAALALSLFFGSIYHFSGGEWMGFGDVKFALFLGFATPGLLVFGMLLFASLLGSIVGILLILLKGKNMKTEIPFGTFLSVSCIILVYFGSQIFSWYFELISSIL
jgi:leader peptidase (prepilin peptidase) / N-methyltransferase